MKKYRFGENILRMRRRRSLEEQTRGQAWSPQKWSLTRRDLIWKSRKWKKRAKKMTKLEARVCLYFLSCIVKLINNNNNNNNDFSSS